MWQKDARVFLWAFSHSFWGNPKAETEEKKIHIAWVHMQCMPHWQKVKRGTVWVYYSYYSYYMQYYWPQTCSIVISERGRGRRNLQDLFLKCFRTPHHGQQGERKTACMLIRAVILHRSHCVLHRGKERQLACVRRREEDTWGAGGKIAISEVTKLNSISLFFSTDNFH